MVLAEVQKGKAFRVKGVRIGAEVGKRLSDMGFTNGAEGSVMQRGLFGGPYHVKIRGYDIMIRKTEAAAIDIEES